MKLKGRLLLAAAVIAAVLPAGAALCQEMEKPQGGAKEGTEAAWQKAAAPGAHQKYLEAMVGEWQVTGKSWMDPSAEPVTWSGTATKEMIMGGRYLREGLETEMLGQVFDGLGIVGYNNLTAKYQYVWLDNMSTALFISEGTSNDKGTEFTLSGEYEDPMTGAKTKMKTVITIVGGDKHTYVAYTIGPDGEETKVMDITYLRQ